jgi:AraC-like DNA-binding protein
LKDEALAETHVVGTATREERVRAQECPPLAGHHIAHVGIADAAAPYEMVRLDLSGAYFLSCHSGHGQILLDGRWQTCRAGWACLAPAHARLAFRAVKGTRWGFTWVRYVEQAGQRRIISSSSPALARFDPAPIRAAVQGLAAEMRSQVAPMAVTHWVELIHTYVLRFAQPWQSDDRLGHLWDYVATRLGERWSLDLLAARCHLSTEHLRRLCRRELGRSPMHQVIYLRMQLAAKLLATSDDKIETIAHEVGYENPFVFSTTFKKWVGWRPSEYRAKRR